MTVYSQRERFWWAERVEGVIRAIRNVLELLAMPEWRIRMRSTTRLFLLAVIAGTVFLGSGSAYALPEIGSEAFLPVTGCGCHSSLIEDWQPSMHAKALSDPLYMLKRDEANRATDGELGEFCDSCHGPIAVMSGENADLATASPQSLQGVVCDFCHQVTGTNDPLGNVSQILEADGTKRAQFDDANSPAHETAYSAFHESAQFCGACHNVDHPTNGLHLESTYTEWSEGPYAAEGIVCQDCHMTFGPGVTKPYPGTAAAGGPQRDHVYLMTFVGGNVGLGDSVLAEERLKAAATLTLSVDEIVAPGDMAEIATTITNVGAGHYIPTGLTEVREMWLEVKAVYPDGVEEVLGTHEFGSILKDAEGNSPAELWEAVAFEKDDRIPPRESVTDTFEFTMPERDEAEIQAALFYRSCSEEMAEKAGVEIPTTTMASASQAVYGSDAIASAAKTSEGGGDGGSNGLLLSMAVVGLALGVGTVGWFALRGRKGSSSAEG